MTSSTLTSGAAEKDPIRTGVRLRRQLLHDSINRTYLIYVPTSYSPNKKVPLLFVFHGGGGRAEQIARFTGFDRLAARDGFIAVYPQAVDRHWNDGRASKVFARHDAKTNDVGFVIALLESLKAEFAIDANAVFATGPSNGGIFSNRLALEHSRHFAAVAPVIAGLAEPLKDARPEKPVSVLMINGTEDPLVPYEGGPVVVKVPGLGRAGDRGRVVGAEDTARFWLDRNAITAEPRRFTLAQREPDDRCTVEVTKWDDDRRNLSVALYKIIGGGHTWPQGPQYLPERLVGRTCRDFNASGVIWDFLSRHHR